MKLVRLATGHYRFGDCEIEDRYDPSGAPHTRLVTLTRDRWVLTRPGHGLQRFDRLKDAVGFLRQLTHA